MEELEREAREHEIEDLESEVDDLQDEIGGLKVEVNGLESKLKAIKSNPVFTASKGQIKVASKQIADILTRMLAQDGPAGRDKGAKS